MRSTDDFRVPKGSYNWIIDKKIEQLNLCIGQEAQ